MALADLLRGETAYLDANAFIYNVEGYPAYASAVDQISDMMESGEVRAVTSEITLAEVLVKPIADGDHGLVQQYKDTISTSEGLIVAPVSRAILIDAAGVRARNKSVRLGDAIHVATAQATRCGSIVTNDKQWKSIPGIRVIILSDFATP